jgi:hypothetical protein
MNLALYKLLCEWSALCLVPMCFHLVIMKTKTKQKKNIYIYIYSWSECASELYQTNDRRLPAKSVPTFFPDSGVSPSQRRMPYGRNLDFLNDSRYLFFQVAHQLYSRGWVDPVPNLLLLRKSGSAWNRTRISGSVIRNYGHYNSEEVHLVIITSVNCLLIFVGHSSNCSTGQKRSSGFGRPPPRTSPNRYAAVWQNGNSITKLNIWPSFYIQIFITI